VTSTSGWLISTLLKKENQKTEPTGINEQRTARKPRKDRSLHLLQCTKHLKHIHYSRALVATKRHVHQLHHFCTFVCNVIKTKLQSALQDFNPAASKHAGIRI